jgi:hypothetical protein
VSHVFEYPGGMRRLFRAQVTEFPFEAVRGPHHGFSIAGDCGLPQCLQKLGRLLQKNLAQLSQQVLVAP